MLNNSVNVIVKIHLLNSIIILIQTLNPSSLEYNELSPFAYLSFFFTANKVVIFTNIGINQIITAALL